MSSGDVGDPMLWPEGASDAYVAGRLELAHAEAELRDSIERVAAARRRLPPGPPVADYQLTLAATPASAEADGGAVGERIAFARLFDGHETLMVYHLMFHPDTAEACPMCSLWVDGFNGVVSHITQHTGFAVVAKAPAGRLGAWARSRGWDALRVLSSHGTSFNADLRAEHTDGSQRPMISVFERDATGGTGVRHRYSLPANFLDGSERGIDQLSPVWNLLDLLPGGRGEWYAQNRYPARPRTAADQVR